MIFTRLDFVSKARAAMLLLLELLFWGLFHG